MLPYDAMKSPSPACLGLAAGLLLPPLASASPEGIPPLSVIIERAVARDDATQKALRAMQYRQSTHTEELDGKGKVTKQQELQLIVRPGAAQELQVVAVKGDNLPSNPDEAIQKAKGQEIERRKHNFSLKELVTRFNITLAGTGNYLGQKAYVVAFEPKPDQPYRDQTEKVLNQLHGQLWIRAKDDVVMKTEATLAHPVQIAWIFARISALDFHYELRSATDDFGPAWLQVTVEVDAPLINIRQRQTVDMTHFESRGRLATVRNPE